MRRFLFNTCFILVATALLVIGQDSWAPAQDVEQGPLTVRARSVNFTTGAQSGTYGKLAWRGGLQLSSDDPRFGGFSSMIANADGNRLLAVSDQGWWLKLDLVYDGDGRLSDVGHAEMAPVLDAKGKRYARKHQRDAEAMTALSDKGMEGPVAIGFENKPRIDRYEFGAKGFAARPEPLGVPLPEALRKGPRNAELESLARFSSGKFKDRLMAISERNLDKQGNIRAWILGRKAPVAFALERLETFSITDVVVLPDQDFVTVERDFSRADRRLRMAIRRFSPEGIAEGKTLKGETLLIADWPRTSIDNMEAIATYRSSDGEQRLLVMSDDNYNGFLQRTLLLQFALPAAADDLG